MPRSSIVVSDEPLSKETNYRTEFVAVLSNQPQGGFITRQPATDMRVADDDFRRRRLSLFPGETGTSGPAIGIGATTFSGGRGPAVRSVSR